MFKLFLFIREFKVFLPQVLIFFLITTSLDIRAQCGAVISTFPYTEDFEIVPAWTSGGANSDWAWGTPAHPAINTAGSGTKCWMIGGLTGSFYNYSELSWLMSPCFDFTTLNYPWISFKIYWEDEWKYDGMVLQYSLNGGNTWTNVGAYGDPANCLNANWYDYNNVTWLTSANPKNGWTGREGATVGTCQGGNGSLGWVTAMHCMSALANQPSVRFRFLFGAGTTCNSYDGIAIDDVLIENAPPNSADFTYICVGANTVNFTNTSTECPTGYLWDFNDPASGIDNTSTVQSPSHTFSSAGTYNVTLTSSGPCNAPSTITIPITILSVNAIVTNETCAGSNNGSIIANVTGGNGTYIYTWTSGQTTDTITGLAPGTYNLTVSAANACPVSTSATLVAQPPITVTVNSPTICAGQSATLVASGATSYSWSVGATAIGTDSATASPNSSITYTVTGTSGTCSSTAVATVSVSTALNVTVNSPAICIGQTAILVANGANTYTWSVGATAAGIDSATASPNTTTTYTVTGVSGTCSDTAVAMVTVSNALNVTVNSPTICTGQTAILVANGANTYSWSAGTTATGITTATATPPNTTTYTVTGTSGSCSGTSVSTVTVNQLPVVTINSPIICSGQTATLIANGANTYTWSAGAVSSGINIATVSPIATNTYTVTGTMLGCSNTAISTVTVGGSITITATGDTICAGTTAHLSANGGTNYIWSNGATSTGINTAIAEPTVNATYTVTGSSVGCTGTAIASVFVNSTPIASFTTPLSTSEFYPVINFTNNSTDATQWNWNFGDFYNPSTNTSFLENPTHTYSSEGNYCITLIVNNTYCKDSTTECIDITPEFTFYIPNAFTPNGDGENDEFYGMGQNISSYEMDIFNRWGELIFISNDTNKHWDGTINGNIAQEGVYVYKFNITDTFNNQHRYIGSVTLIK